MGVFWFVVSNIGFLVLGWAIGKLLDLPGKAARDEKERKDKYDAVRMALEEFWRRLHPGEEIPSEVREKINASAGTVYNSGKLTKYEPVVMTGTVVTTKPKDE